MANARHTSDAGHLGFLFKLMDGLFEGRFQRLGISTYQRPSVLPVVDSVIQHHILYPLIEKAPMPVIDPSLPYIGRASGCERECQSVSISVVAVTLRKKIKNQSQSRRL